MAKEKQTGIRMEESTYQALEKIGKRMDRPVSWLIREAIKQFIAANKS